MSAIAQGIVIFIEIVPLIFPLLEMDLAESGFRNKHKTTLLLAFDKNPTLIRKNLNQEISKRISPRSIFYVESPPMFVLMFLQS